MTAFKKKYAGERRQAMFRAHFEHDITYSEISRRAATGQLVPGDPFTIPPQYVGELCRQERDRRAGQFSSPLADKPHRDAVEDLRRRAIGIADYMSTDMLAIARKHPERVDPKRAQELARLVTYISSIPAASGEPTAAAEPRKPADRIRGKMGALLAAAQAETQNGEGPRDGGPSEDSAAAD